MDTLVLAQNIENVAERSFGLVQGIAGSLFGIVVIGIAIFLLVQRQIAGLLGFVGVAMIVGLLIANPDGVANLGASIASAIGLT